MFDYSWQTGKILYYYSQEKQVCIKTRQDKTMFILLLKMSIRIQIQSAKTKKTNNNKR